MRLSVLDKGQSVRTKALFAMIRVFSGHPVLDVIKLARYRPEFYGKLMGQLTHEAMRGPSAWSVGDRELMAAVVAKTNACPWCTSAHCAVARRAYGDDAKIAAVTDLDAAPIEAPLRATLRMLQKLARERALGSDDMRAVRAAGVSRRQIEDALAVFFAFSVVTRLANAFGFAMPEPAAFESGAKYLLARGYR